MVARRIGLAGGLALLAVLAAGQDPPSGTGEAPPADDGTVIVFLIDNSASLPPLDPTGRRRDALEKMYGFLEGRAYRLVLFGGRHEIDLDAPEKYRSHRRWTDFYWAFRKVGELRAAYPADTELKLILVTDGILDPSPDDWADEDLDEGVSFEEAVARRAVAELERLGLALYVLLVGEKVDDELVRRMVRAANGPLEASELAQGLSEFFDDDGMLVKQFIYRVEPETGLAAIEPAIRRIAAPERVGVELSLLGSLLGLVALVVGVSVRSFPGRGDREIVELRLGEPVHVAADRFRRLDAALPAWSWRGLCLTEDPKTAAATLTLVRCDPNFPPEGVALDGADPFVRSLVELPPAELAERLAALAAGDDAELAERARALDAAARDYNAERAARLLTAPHDERRRLDPIDFLRAKAHLLHNDTLRDRLTRPRLVVQSYGRRADRREVYEGGEVAIGRYDFDVEAIEKGGRKDYRVVLAYRAAPSFLGLKRLVPTAVQRAVRLRRTRERVVR